MAIDGGGSEQASSAERLSDARRTKLCTKFDSHPIILERGADDTVFDQIIMPKNDLVQSTFRNFLPPAFAERISAIRFDDGLGGPYKCVRSTDEESNDSYEIVLSNSAMEADARRTTLAAVGAAIRMQLPADLLAAYENTTKDADGYDFPEARAMLPTAEEYENLRVAEAAFDNAVQSGLPDNVVEPKQKAFEECQLTIEEKTNMADQAMFDYRFASAIENPGYFGFGENGTSSFFYDEVIIPNLPSQERQSQMFHYQLEAMATE